MIIEVVSSIFLFTGSVFMLISALGIVRLPDLYTRMHAATKASSLGIMLILASLCIYFFTWVLLMKAILSVVFIFATVPVASHLLAGTGHMLNVKKWKNTVADEWQDNDQ